MKKTFLYIIISLIGQSSIVAQLISETKLPNSFSLSDAAIYVDESDFALVKKSAELLRQDIEKVTGRELPIINNLSLVSGSVIIIGSIEKSHVIGELIKQKKIDVKNIKGKWEAFLVQSLQTIKADNKSKSPPSGGRGP